MKGNSVSIFISTDMAKQQRGIAKSRDKTIDM